jgi:large subunit ribosomal protein L23
MSVLKKPLVTEKASAQNENGKYGFLVEKKANKIQIRQEVEKMYGVKVVDVNTMSYRGKHKYRYTKTRIVGGKKSDYKKAVITVAEGEVIDFYGSV